MLRDLPRSRFADEQEVAPKATDRKKANSKLGATICGKYASRYNTRIEIEGRAMIVNVRSIVLGSALAVLLLPAARAEVVSLTIKPTLVLPVVKPDGAKADVLGIALGQTIPSIAEELKRNGFVEPFKMTMGGTEMQNGTLKITVQQWTSSIETATADARQNISVYFSSPATSGVSTSLSYTFNYNGVQNTEPLASDVLPMLEEKYGEQPEIQHRGNRLNDIYVWAFDENGKRAPCGECQFSTDKISNAQPLFGIMALVHRNPNDEQRLSDLQITIVNEFAIAADDRAWRAQIQNAASEHRSPSVLPKF